MSRSNVVFIFKDFFQFCLFKVFSYPYMQYIIVTMLTTHPSFDKNAGAFSSKSTFPQGKVLVGMYVKACAPINNISQYHLTLTDSPGHSRGLKPKGLTVRKVRASGERITDNVRRWRPPGSATEINSRTAGHTACFMSVRGDGGKVR